MGLFDGANPKLPPGNSQWSQLANFFPQDSGAGAKMKGAHHQIDVGAILQALGSLGGPQQAPEGAPPPQWAPMPQPQFRDLLNGPRFGQGQLMAAPPYMAPYMWGAR